MAVNMCSELANLSTMLKGPVLKTVLQTILLASPIKLTCPPEIFEEPKGATEEQEEEPEEEKLKQIFSTCFPHQARLKDENNITRALAVLVFFKLCQQIIRGAKQFEAAAHYSVNQKRLSKVIHRKKYLRGKQKKHRALGTKENPEIVDDEEPKEKETQSSQK